MASSRWVPLGRKRLFPPAASIYSCFFPTQPGWPELLLNEGWMKTDVLKGSCHWQSLWMLFWIWIFRNSIWGFLNSQFSLVITNCRCKQLWAGFSAIWKSNFSKGASDWDWSGSENAAREVRAQPLSSSSSWSICKSLEFSGLGIISC